MVWFADLHNLLSQNCLANFVHLVKLILSLRLLHVVDNLFGDIR